MFHYDTINTSIYVIQNGQFFEMNLSCYYRPTTPHRDQITSPLDTVTSWAENVSNIAKLRN